MSTKIEKETQVEIATQKQEAKKILFDWADVEDENILSDVSKEQLNKFSTSHETEALKKLYDNYDLVDFVKDTGTTDEKLVEKQKQVEQEFAQVAQTVTAPSTAKIEFQKLSTPKVKAKKNSKAKLNFRGKLMIIGYSAVVAVMGFLAIFNIVQINNISDRNAQIEAQISQKESSLDELFTTYKELNNESRISEIVETKNMTKIESTSTTNIALRDSKEYTKESNWFDSVCNFFSSLFGG